MGSAPLDEREGTGSSPRTGRTVNPEVTTAAAVHPEVTAAHTGAPREHRHPSRHVRVTDTASPHLLRHRALRTAEVPGGQSRSHRVNPCWGRATGSSSNGCRSAAVTPRDLGSEQDPDRGPLGTPDASSQGAFGKGTQREGCGKDGAKSLAFCTFWLENAKNSPPFSY